MPPLHGYSDSRDLLPGLKLSLVFRAGVSPLEDYRVLGEIDRSFGKLLPVVVQRELHRPLLNRLDPPLVLGEVDPYPKRFQLTLRQAG